MARRGNLLDDVQQDPVFDTWQWGRARCTGQANATAAHLLVVEICITIFSQLLNVLLCQILSPLHAPGANSSLCKVRSIAAQCTSCLRRSGYREGKSLLDILMISTSQRDNAATRWDQVSTS